MNLLIKSATIIDKNSEFHNQIVDILIEKGIILNIGSDLKNSKNFKEIKFNNLHVSCGWFDYFVSAGEPGFEERDSIKNTINVALKSGFTSIGIQPNCFPITDKKSEIEFIKSRSKDSAINVYPFGALSKNSEGKEMAELNEMRSAGALGFGDYKRSIENPNLLKLSLLYSKTLKYPILSFPDNKSLSKDGVMNENKISTYLGLRGIPPISEETQIARDIAILKYTGGNLHIPTISTAESVKLIRKAKKDKLNISCSTTIHNIFFDDQNLEQFDTNFKVLPPLRTTRDIIELIDGLKDGTIDMVTCDHNPINLELKNIEFDNAHFGTIGLESFFGALNSIFSLKKSISILTIGKKIFGIKQNKLKIGEYADLTLFNPQGKYIFNHDNIHSKSKNSIFINQKLTGKVYGTFVNGKLTLND